MKAACYYNLTTGLFRGDQVVADQAGIDALCPTGYASIDGHYDPLSQKVDLTTLTVVAYIPPSPTPTANYQWNTTTLRWELTAARAALVAQDAAARNQIAALQAQAMLPLVQFAAGVNLLANVATLTSLNTQILAQQALLLTS